MLGEFLETRGGVILSHQTDMQRRIDRLNGVAPSMGNSVSMLTSYLPGIVQGGAALGLTLTYSGIGGNTQTYGGRLGVSVPLN